MQVQVIEILAGGGAQTVTWDTNMLREEEQLVEFDNTLDLVKFAELLEAGNDISNDVLKQKGMEGCAIDYSWSYSLHQYESFIVRSSDSPFEQQITLYTE